MTKIITNYFIESLFLILFPSFYGEKKNFQWLQVKKKKQTTTQKKSHLNSLEAAEFENIKKDTHWMCLKF